MSRVVRQNRLAKIVLLSLAMLVVPQGLAQAVGTVDQPATGASWSVSGNTATNTLQVSGITTTVSVTSSAGYTNQLDSVQPNLSGAHGSVNSDFKVPPVNTATKAIQPRWNGGTASCRFPNAGAGTSITCPNIGTLRIAFSRPVVDPILSIAGIGGGGSTNYIWATYQLTQPAGATVSLLQGNGILTASGNQMGISRLGAAPLCSDSQFNGAMGGQSFLHRDGCLRHGPSEWGRHSL